MRKSLKFLLLIMLIPTLFSCNNIANNQITRLSFSEEFENDTLVLSIDDHKILPISYDGKGDFSDLDFEVDKEGIIVIKNGSITGINGGIVNITITPKHSFLSNHKSIPQLSLTVYVNDFYNYNKGVLRLDFATNGLIIGRSMDLCVYNMLNVGASSINDFIFESSNPNVIKIENNKVIAVGNGESVIKVRQIGYPSNTGESTIYVGPQETSKTLSNEPDGGALIAFFDDEDFTIDCNTDEQINILGALNMQRYKYQTSDENTLLISDTGMFMGVKEGIVTVRITSKDAIIKDENSRFKATTQIKITVKGARKRNYIDSLLKVALAEEGYTELPGRDNNTKYGEWNNCNFEAWCATFVSWCANNAGVPKEILSRSISVRIYQTNYENKDLFFLKEDYIPVPGDLIIFTSQGASHIGIVINASDSTVYTIEGNTSNGVARREYPLNYGTITGYAHPAYGEQSFSTLD